MFQLEFSPEALDDLQYFRVYEQREILQTIEVQLTYQPTNPTRNRKQLKLNNLAEWELRIKTFRVFYDVDLQSSLVIIRAVGYKQVNKLFIQGEEYPL